MWDVKKSEKFGFNVFLKAFGMNSCSSESFSNHLELELAKQSISKYKYRVAAHPVLLRLVCLTFVGWIINIYWFDELKNKFLSLREIKGVLSSNESFSSLMWIVVLTGVCSNANHSFIELLAEKRYLSPIDIMQDHGEGLLRNVMIRPLQKWVPVETI